MLNLSFRFDKTLLYSPEGSAITIQSSTQQNGLLVLSIQDRGRNS